MPIDGPGSASAHAALSAAADGGTADSLRRADRGDEASRREAARQFEAWFVKTMTKSLRQAGGAGQSGLFSGGGMETWNDLFDQEIADRIVEGRGIGLADAMMRSLNAYGRPPRPADPGGLAEGLSWPLPEAEPGRVSSRFGVREDPVHGGRAAHLGLDLAAPEGTAILAVRDGTVLRAGEARGFGRLIEVDHGDGVIVRYAHASEVDVRPGDRVRGGDRIGAVGSTGRATGAHLHLEVRVDGEARDPEAFLRGVEPE